jgi:hypothetical protein
MDNNASSVAERVVAVGAATLTLSPELDWAGYEHVCHLSWFDCSYQVKVPTALKPTEDAVAIAGRHIVVVWNAWLGVGKGFVPARRLEQCPAMHSIGRDP